MPEHVAELKKLIEESWEYIGQYAEKRDILGVKVMINSMAAAEHLVRHPWNAHGEEWESVWELACAITAATGMKFPYIMEIIKTNFPCLYDIYHN